VRCPVADNRYRGRACAIEPDGGPNILCITRGRISRNCTRRSCIFHSDIGRSGIGAASVGLGRYIGCRGHGRAEISR